MVFEYMEFINLARSRIHIYKEKFYHYLDDSKVPLKEIYSTYMEEHQTGIIQLYENQKRKIEEQFAYLQKLIDELKEIELENLFKFKEYFLNLFLKISKNYDLLNDEILIVKTMIDDKEKSFLQFQNSDQIEKEDVMKNVSIEENVLNVKKKTIIKSVTNFHRDSSQIERIKRYFEVLIEKYKENKINELVKVIEKKKNMIQIKYSEIDFDEYLKILIYEFEQISLISSRNYFSVSSRELFISIVNTNKIFSYSLDSNKYYITEVDFKDLPVQKFPNYSRSLIINGNLIVNGGYDEKNKVTLPYNLFYERVNKSIVRLSDMIYGHSAHSLIYIPPHYIYVISGSGTLKCEKYSMEDNTWTEIPEINVCRQNCSLFYYNKQYLYAFGGAYWDDTAKSFVYIESVERLNLGYGSVEGSKKWENIQTYKFGSVNLRKSVMAVLSFSSNKIYLVGGSINYNTYTDEIITFDLEKNEFRIKEGLVLPIKTCFPNKSFMFFNEKAFQLDNDGNVFEFDIQKDKITVIKENTAIKKKEVL